MAGFAESYGSSTASSADDAITQSAGYGLHSLLPTMFNGTHLLREGNSTDSTPSPEMEALWAMHLALHGIVMPIVSLIGVMTNLANIVVLSKIIQRSRTPVYHILLAMAVADFLLMGVVLLYSVRFYLRAKPIVVKEDAERIDLPSHFFFHTWESFANVCGMASNWCVVAVTLFRFIAVYFPLHAPVWCTRQRARVIIVCIFVAAVVMNVPYALVVQFNPSTSQFVLLKEVDDAYKSSYYVVLLVCYHVIPWIASVVLVALLLVGLWSQQRIARACSKQEEQKNVEQKKLSVTLISVAAWFVVSSAPKVVYQFISYACDEEVLNRPPMQRFFVWSQMALLLNYAANFFMYAFINRTYRGNLVAILRCQKAAVGVVSRNGHSVHTVMTTHLSASAELHPLKNGDERYAGH